MQPANETSLARRDILKIAMATSFVSLTGASHLLASEETPITGLSACDLSAAIHARKISCVEVMTDYLDRIDAALRATLERVGDARLTCRYTRARTDILLARIADRYERGWRVYEDISNDESIPEAEVRRAGVVSTARDNLAELREAAGDQRPRLLRGLRRLHHPNHLESRDWDALQSTIQREQSVCR